MQVHSIHRILQYIKYINHELQIPQQSWLIKYATIITHTTSSGSYNSLTIHDLYTAFMGLFNRQHILNAYKLGFLYANGHNLSKMCNLLPSRKWEFVILQPTINLQQQHIVASIFNTEVTTTIMQPERISTQLTEGVILSTRFLSLLQIAHIHEFATPETMLSQHKYGGEQVSLTPLHQISAPKHSYLQR